MTGVYNLNHTIFSLLYPHTWEGWKSPNFTHFKQWMDISAFCSWMDSNSHYGCLRCLETRGNMGKNGATATNQIAASENAVLWWLWSAHSFLFSPHFLLFPPPFTVLPPSLLADPLCIGFFTISEYVAGPVPVFPHCRPLNILRG